MAELELTTANFEQEVINSDVPVVVDFFADWCGPCKMMSPVLQQLADAHNGKLKVGKFDVDSDTAFAGNYGISSIPCLILFKDGKETDRQIGFKPFPELDSWVKKYL